MKKALVFALTLAFASTASLAEPLTRDAIVALAKSGIGDDAIVAKLRRSGETFDLSTDDMMALKQQGVSSAVIAAMLGSGAPAAPRPLSVDASDPMVAHAPGVYVLRGDKMSRIDATVSNQAKTGGILGYAFTGGIASVSVKAAIQNANARVRTGGAPVFYFFFDESNGSPQSGTWLSGTAATVTSPSEFTLVKLMEKDGRREARVGSTNIGDMKAGVMDKDRIQFAYDLVRPGVYKVTPSQSLKKGEYGFLYAIGGGGTTGAMTARIYDFGVDEAVVSASR